MVWVKKLGIERQITWFYSDKRERFKLMSCEEGQFDQAKCGIPEVLMSLPKATPSSDKHTLRFPQISWFSVGYSKNSMAPAPANAPWSHEGGFILGGANLRDIGMNWLFQLGNMVSHLVTPFYIASPCGMSTAVTLINPWEFEPKNRPFWNPLSCPKTKPRWLVVSHIYYLYL